MLKRHRQIVAQKDMQKRHAIERQSTMKLFLYQKLKQQAENDGDESLANIQN